MKTLNIMKTLLTLLFSVCSLGLWAQLPNWSQGPVSQEAQRKYPCWQYDLIRRNTNKSISVEVEYFDCYGKLVKTIVPPPSGIGVDTVTIISICSWSYPEANQWPLPEAGIPVVTEVVAIDGCFETYYIPSTGGGDYTPHPWPTTPAPPHIPNIPYVPAPSNDRTKPDCEPWTQTVAKGYDGKTVNKTVHGHGNVFSFRAEQGKSYTVTITNSGDGDPEKKVAPIWFTVFGNLGTDYGGGGVDGMFSSDLMDFYQEVAQYMSEEMAVDWEGGGYAVSSRSITFTPSPGENVFEIHTNQAIPDKTPSGYEQGWFTISVSCGN